MKRKSLPAASASGPARAIPMRLATASPRTLHEAASSWWMITLSDLTILLLGFAVLGYMSARPAGPRLATRSAPAEGARSAVSPAADKAPGAAMLHAVQNDLTRFVGAAGLTDQVVIELAPGEILFSILDNVPFASGKADLRRQALPVLEKIAALVLANPELSVAISGHTDSRRIANAAYPSNWELSTARASRVARYLIEKGIHPKRISVQGFADHRPRETNSTPIARRINRRVEIKLFQENPVAMGGRDEK